ncbi:MAG: hypothetical protein S4CHLAM6_03310 [Chlamydiae bacterium]|nr:hypothetical protein [Chlamydiota bacterium]
MFVNCKLFMKFSLFISLLFSSALVFSLDTVDHILKLDYQIVNKIEISPQNLHIELVRERGRFFGSSDQEAEMGIVSNDGREKKLLVEQIKNFNTPDNFELMVCCQGSAFLKNSGFVAIGKKSPVVLIDKIDAFCNESSIPISYSIQNREKITSRIQQCAIRYTLMDH